MRPTGKDIAASAYRLVKTFSRALLLYISIINISENHSVVKCCLRLRIATHNIFPMFVSRIHNDLMPFLYLECITFIEETIVL